MASHKRKANAEDGKSGPSPAKKPRYVKLDLQSAVDKCLEWAKRIDGEERLSKRDTKRVQEAFQVLAEENKDGSYRDFLGDAELTGGRELVLLFALALGKATFRDMAGEVKWRLPLKVAETECHRSTSLRELVLQFLEKGKLKEPPVIFRCSTSSRGPFTRFACRVFRIFNRSGTGCCS